MRGPGRVPGQRGRGEGRADTAVTQDTRFSEASLAHCGEHATCTNSMGSFSCPCNTGYTGFQAGVRGGPPLSLSLPPQVGCVDEDECSVYSSSASSYCGSYASCTNTIGSTTSPNSFACTCNTGFTGWASYSGELCDNLLAGLCPRLPRYQRVHR